MKKFDFPQEEEVEISESLESVGDRDVPEEPQILQLEQIPLDSEEEINFPLSSNRNPQLGYNPQYPYKYLSEQIDRVATILF